MKISTAVFFWSKTNSLIPRNLRKVPQGLVPPQSLPIIGRLLPAANHMVGVAEASVVPYIGTLFLVPCPCGWGLGASHYRADLPTWKGVFSPLHK